MSRNWLIALLLSVSAPASAETDCSPAGIEAARKQFGTYYSAKDCANAETRSNQFMQIALASIPRALWPRRCSAI
jgi:hypothetical protein